MTETKIAPNHRIQYRVKVIGKSDAPAGGPEKLVDKSITPASHPAKMADESGAPASMSHRQHDRLVGYSSGELLVCTLIEVSTTGTPRSDNLSL